MVRCRVRYKVRAIKSKTSKWKLLVVWLLNNFIIHSFFILISVINQICVIYFLLIASMDKAMVYLLKVGMHSLQT